MRNRLKKYLTIISIHWQRNLLYRGEILMYRVGETISQLALIILWLAIYKNTPLISGFTVNEMITYVSLGNFFNVLSRNFLARIVAIDIREGNLSAYLLRPMSYLEYMLMRVLGGHSQTALMSGASQLIVVAIFYNKIIFNPHILTILVIIGMIIFSFATEFLLNFLIGTIAFWTEEVDGIFDSIMSLKRLFSGSLFPLSLLPAFLLTLSYALPFSYSFFVPMQLYLNKIDIWIGLRGLLIQIGWIIILYILCKISWKRGLKRYEGVGI